MDRETTVNKNVGGADMAFRLIIGGGIVVLGCTPWVSGGWQVACFVVGGILLATGITAYCPINALFKVNTHRKPVDEVPRVKTPAGRT